MLSLESNLVEAARQGDQIALGKLIAMAQPELRRFARRQCASSADADDAVQVALWRMHSQIGQLRAAPAFASWMFRIIQRECIRLFNLLRRFTPLDTLDNRDADFYDFPYELRRDLVVAITLLPDMYREVLILCDIEELSAAEATKQLNISLPALKSRLHRARALVRDNLLAGGYFSESNTAEK